MKNKLTILTGAFCLLFSANVMGQNTLAAAPKAMVEIENKDLKQAAVMAPVSATEKNMQPGAVGFQQSNTEEVKAIVISAESSTGLKPINRDRPKPETFRPVPPKPVIVQQPDAEAQQVIATPKVQKAEQ